MKVSNGYNSFAYQQQRTNDKGKGFADMLAGMAASKHGKPEMPKDSVDRSPSADTPYSHLRLVNPHKNLGTEIKLTSEQSAELEKMKRGEPSGSECLEKYEEVDKPEFHYSQPFEIPAPKYPASIYDIPANDLKNQLEAAKEACNALDTEGMSKAEIYSSIETIYKNYLGYDFKLPSLVGGVFSEHNFTLSTAHHQFNRQLKGYGISTYDSDAMREAKGYSGMSDSEIKAAVRGQYPDVMTLKDCILMSHEFKKLGFKEEGAAGSRMTERIFSTMGMGWSPEAQKVFDAMLNMPADFDAFMSKYEAFAKNDYKRYAAQNADEMFEELMSWMGGGGLYNQEMLSQLRGMVDKVPLDQDLSKVVIG